MKKKYKLLLLALMICLSLSACKNQSTDSESVQTTTESTSSSAAQSSSLEDAELKVSSLNLSETSYFEEGSDTIVASVEVRFPKFEGDTEAIMNINSYYSNFLESQAVYFRGDFSEMARDNYSFTQDNGTAFQQFSIRSDFWVSCNDGKYISVVRDYDELISGASSHTTLACDTFNAETGVKISLSDIFSVSEELYLKKLFPIMKSQAKSKTDLYQNYETLIEENFNPEDFYIVDEDGDKILFLVYQPYDIAPGNVGVIDFSIPFSELKEILK